MDADRRERGDEVNNVLERLDTAGLPEGPYTLRLTVNRGDGPKVAPPVTIDNTPPTLVVSEPKPDRLYVMEDDEQINVNVLVNDNWAVDRVEFMIDGTGFGDSTVSPYNERWQITMRDINSAEGGTPWLGFTSDDPDVQPGTRRNLCRWLPGRRTSGGVYLEGHTIKVRAFDRAGNSD